MGFPGEKGPFPMYSLFFFWIKLLHTQIRRDNLNGKHQGGRYARQEKKLLMKIACATEERESCLEYVVHQRWDLKMKYTFKHNLK